MGLKYKWHDETTELEVYGDCSFSPTGRYSQEGNVAFAGSSLVDWRSKRQTLMATSSCEGELIAASSSLVMGRKMRLLLTELTGREKLQFRIHCDNTAAIAQIRQGDDAGWRNRHVSIRAFAIVVAVRHGETTIEFCETALMAADGLTKGVGPQILSRMMELWNMVSVV